MKSISTLYDGKNTIQKLINNKDVFQLEDYFVRIYIANSTKDEAVSIAKEIKELLPNSKIMGGSASGIIYKNDQYLDKNLVMIDSYENTKVEVKSFIWEGKIAKEVATEVTDSFTIEPNIMHIFCGEHYYDSHDFVTHFNKLNKTTKIVGGVMGDVLPHNIKGFVFTEDGVIDNGILIGALSSESLRTYCGVNIAHEPISTIHKLTKTTGSLWHSVNNEPANEWLKEQLGIDDLHEFNDWKAIVDNDIMIKFPVILENHNGASRFLRYDSKNKCLSQYFSMIPLNTEFRIGYVSPSECVKESFKICNEIMEYPIETLFCYSCLFRRLYLNNCAEWEIRPYKEIEICGAFLMGEFAHINGTNEFLNGVSCIVGLSENEKYIRPNINIYEELHAIEDDNKNLLNTALKKQSENINKYNQELLDKLIIQQKTSQEQMYIDYNTGVANYIKYKEDLKSINFNKICMVKVENSQVLITHFGHDYYINVIKRALQQVKESINNTNEALLLSRYVFNENTFFIAADDKISSSHFIDLSTMLFNKFRFLKINDSDDVLINRGVVVVDETELIEIALNTFQASKQLQTPFLVCENNNNKFSTSDEFKMIGVLNRALKNDGIVPYFQGIFDNETNTIYKYEALMRIVDFDGTVYMPLQFMDIAKKYHLYTHLSKAMIDRVFNLFKDRIETVTLNFSVNDINSNEMVAIYYEKLELIGDASNIVIEILEDEEFKDIEKLKEFIYEVRQYGVKIAIDDFGAGYSNLLEIANINPDYIKVDGSIVKEIHINERNRKLLDVIVYLGESFDMEIIAEFVENEEIQNYISTKKIKYSQGYYFAKPIPFEDLKLLNKL